MYIHLVHTSYLTTEWVQYEITYQDRTRIVKHLGYGDLEKILVITLPTKSFLTDFSGRTVVFALVTPWDTDGKDATKENLYMTQRRASVIMDARSLQAVIGLVETRGKWGIIDRTGESIMTTFTDVEMEIGLGLESDDHLV